MANLSQHAYSGTSEEVFKLLVEGIKDYAIFMLDTNGIVLSWNPGAERIKGYKANEIIGKHFSTFYRKEDVERGHPSYELEVASRAGKYEEEGLRIRKDGSIFAASVLITALHDTDGNLRGFSKVTRDITEQQRVDALTAAAEAIENERTNFRNLFHHTPEMVCILRGPDHIFEFVNESHVRVIGADVTGKTVREAQPESVEVHGILDSVYCTGKTVDVIEAPVTVGKRLRHFNLTFSARYKVDGSVGGVMVLGTEVTDAVINREGTVLLNKALQLALNNSPMSEVLNVLTMMVEKQTGGTLLASILLASEDGLHLLHGAAPSLPKAYNDLIHGIAIGPAVGSCGTAAFRKEPVFVSDIQNDPLWKDFKHLASEYGVVACWSIPILKQSGKLIGTFALYSTIPRSPTARELETARAAAQTTALILERQMEIRDRLAAAKEVERERAKFKAANENLEGFFMQAPLPMVIFEGPNHHFTLANEPYEKFVGRKVVGKDLTVAFPQGEAELFTPILNEVYSTGVPFIGKELPVDLPDENGAMVAHRIDIGYHPFRRPDGSIKGILVLLQDVTERVAARVKVEEAEANLRAAINSSAGGFYGVDPIGNTTVCNSAFLTMLGFEREEDVVGKRLHDVIHHTHPDGRRYDKTDCPIYQAASAGKPAHVVDELFFRLDSSSFPVEYWTAPILREGQVLGAVTTFVDISERKLAESALRLAKENAEQLRAEAERANLLKSAFLANMSHEIRTPLGAMLGFADLLKDPGLSPGEQANYINIMTRNGEQLSHIINDILDLSKVEAGHLNLEFTDTHHTIIGSDIVSLLHVKAREKDLALEYAYDDSTPEVITADPTRVRQILLNLVGNAIKFTQFGSVKIKTYGCHTGARAALCFEVSDTGIGISPEQQSRLFQPFSQADETTTRKFGGTGLGLALSRRLARELGGDITIIRSEVGIGTTFLVKIVDQSEKRSAPEDTFKFESRVEPEIKDNELAGMKILVVDDAPDNQQLIWRYLTKQGASVQSAENGLIGYRTALAGDFDLVLMDIQMPVMDGYTATQKLREAGYRKPVVALTAHAMNEIRKKALNVGYTDHLTKPIKPKELVATIVKLVGSKRDSLS